jgi:hypothetical protein
MTFDEFLSHTSKVDILILELATMRQFLKLEKKTEVIGHAVAEETLTKTADYAITRPFYDSAPQDMINRFYGINIRTSRCTKQPVTGQQSTREALVISSQSGTCVLFFCVLL